MLLKLFSRFFQFGKNKKLNFPNQLIAVEEANLLMASGDRHGAILAFRKYLESDPYNVQILNNLGVCLSDIGNNTEASSIFELAFSLDDTFLPVMVNRAKMLSDLRCSTDAMPYLRLAKISKPDQAHIDAVYADICLAMGNVDNAKYFKRRAWLTDFDNLRLVNGYLFYTSFNEENEALLAAEHQFWAETVHPINFEQVSAIIGNTDADLIQIKPKYEVDSGVNKLRIGYWSPDFRNHSVRYFFRPLLENHDLSKVEVFLYHDFPKSDAQTELMESVCPNFFRVSELSDKSFHELVLSHHLDIFVELAGHSSHNRVALLQHRFADLQLSALGYPPTTGLTSIDAKLLDRHVLTPSSQSHYSEAPLVMPHSFWCFDPMEVTHPALEPPLVQNGYATFACVGNIAKITDHNLLCWKAIFSRLEDYRLVIRSISFEDPVSQESMMQRLIAHGLAISKVDLLKPAAGPDFFESYNHIDIVLDTFPFNGGTTTCFATYMGVPVVSLFGESLISRMGLSILSNLGVPELAVSSEDSYIECAVRLAQDVDFLKMFKLEARTRFQQSSLGNGKLFAQEFEAACLGLLAEKRNGTFSYHHAISPLPEVEIVRRAYAVLRNGQTDAAQRIIRYALAHYPNCGSAHLLLAQQLIGELRHEEAIRYLLDRMDTFNPSDQIATLITIVRLYLLLENKVDAAHTVDHLARLPLDDTFDLRQCRLYQACCTSAEIEDDLQLQRPDVSRILVLISCDTEEEFDQIHQQITNTCICPAHWNISYQRCAVPKRITAYNNVLNDDSTDILIMVQRNIEIHNPLFFVELVNTLADCDIVGFAGARDWLRLDWQLDSFERKDGGFMFNSSEKPGFIEIQLIGPSIEKTVADLAVLDGRLVAANCRSVRKHPFDDELLGAGTLMEEDWTHAAFKAGQRLTVHRNLGILINHQAAQEDHERAAGRIHLCGKYEFDPFAMTVDDHMILSAPVEDTHLAVTAIENYFR